MTGTATPTPTFSTWKKKETKTPSATSSTALLQRGSDIIRNSIGTIF
jgi:hypothetical protein